VEQVDIPLNSARMASDKSGMNKVKSIEEEINRAQSLIFKEFRVWLVIDN
jgi:hypothetical protein